MGELSSYRIRDYSLADWKYEKIMEEIAEYEAKLDNDHEIALRLASFCWLSKSRYALFLWIC